MVTEDVEYVLVPIPEWKGSVRLGSASAEAVMQYVEARRDSVARRLRLIVASIVDETGARIKPKDITRFVTALRKKNHAVVDRILEAVLKLNDLAVDRVTIKNALGGAVIAASPIA